MLLVRGLLSRPKYSKKTIMGLSPSFRPIIPVPTIGYDWMGMFRGKLIVE
ncbi:MAG: hypothetical protein KJO88_05400 [Gammaproteobacteria bacterium]|nr:hypothetical protein [Gammaproteobacteria bacterium]